MHAFWVQVSLLERTWRYAWRRKGDVYHLLFDLCNYVDGRVWPTSDKTDVLLFLSLVHHVTGQSPAHCTSCTHHVPATMVLAKLVSWTEASEAATGAQICFQCYHMLCLCFCLLVSGFSRCAARRQLGS